MNKQSIDFKDYYYKYKALKYYLKNKKIEGGSLLNPLDQNVDQNDQKINDITHLLHHVLNFEQKNWKKENTDDYYTFKYENDEKTNFTYDPEESSKIYFVINKNENEKNKIEDNLPYITKKDQNAPSILELYMFNDNTYIIKYLNKFYNQNNQEVVNEIMSKTLKYSCKINVIENLQNIVLTIEMNWDQIG